MNRRPVFRSTLFVLASSFVSDIAYSQENTASDSPLSIERQSTDSKQEQPSLGDEVPLETRQPTDVLKTKKTTKFRTRVLKKATQTSDKSNISGTGYGIFGSADLGMIFTAPSNEIYKLIEEPQFGFTPAAKFMGTVFTRRIALDLGLGFQFATYSGSRVGQIDLNNEEFPIIPINEPYSKKQPSLLIESAARIKFKEKFQAGLLATALYSRKSAGFSSLRDGEDLEEVYNIFLGPQFIYESPFSAYISRVGASFSVSLTSTFRDTFQFNIQAGVGSFINKGETIINKKKITRIKTKTVTEVIPLQSKTAEFYDNVVFVFDSRMINFKLNSDQLSEKSKRFVGEIGAVFNQESQLWKELVVEGHTDSRGAASYNQKLSEMRARSVAKILTDSGLEGSKLIVVGMGSTKRLIENEKSELDHAKNRRVEIRPTGLKNARDLKKKIDEVQNKFFGFKRQDLNDILQTQPNQETTPQEPVWDPGID